VTVYIHFLCSSDFFCFAAVFFALKSAVKLTILYKYGIFNSRLQRLCGSFLPEKARILLREKFQYSEGLLQAETRNHQMIEAYT